jgi:hypothetical protein
VSEYSFMVTSIDLKPGIEDASTDSINMSLTQSFSQVIQQVSQGVKSFDGERLVIPEAR